MGVLTTQWREARRVTAPQSGEATISGAAISRLGNMVARSLVMQRLFARLEHAAPHLRIVTFEGDPGTGKALAARTLHGLGPASAAPFVACAATRFASADVQALLDETRSGTLFLTRVSELTADQQSRLFDFLEWWEHRSARETTSLPRQIFVSSQQPLRQLSANGRLRADLSYRLTAVRFILPPLRERREDIGTLAEHFAVHCAAMRGKPVRGLGPGSLPRLMTHHWPGNVRELEAVMMNAVMECEGQWIRPIDIPALMPAAPRIEQQVESLVTAMEAEDDPNLDHMIVRHIKSVLEKTGGNKLRAARLLGISRSTLYRLIEPENIVSQS